MHGFAWPGPLRDLCISCILHPISMVLAVPRFVRVYHGVPGIRYVQVETSKAFDSRGSRLGLQPSCVPTRHSRARHEAM